MRLIPLIIGLLLLIGIVPLASAITNNFQDGGNGTYFICTNTQCYWIQNGTAGNSAFEVDSGGSCCGSGNWIVNRDGIPMSYAAATITSTSGFFGGTNSIKLWGNNMASLLYTYTIPVVGTGRYEVMINGTTANFYRNGVLTGSSTPLSQNPSFIGFGSPPADYSASNWALWDDLVYGDAEEKTIIDLPKTNTYIIKKDMVTPAASGVYYWSNGTLVYTTFLPVFFSRPNTTTNQTIYLEDVATGTIRGAQYTGYDLFGVRNFNIQSDLITSGAPYGLYDVVIGNTHSTQQIAYIADGATITWDRDSYATDDVANISYTIDAGGYWDTSTYSYSVKIVDFYGNLINSQGITTQTGSVIYAWVPSTNQGVYFAELIATPLAGGDPLLMNYDYATLTATFGFNGWINEDESTLPIAGANISYAEGGLISLVVSGPDGNYSTSTIFITGSPIWANASKSGYSNDNWTFTVIKAHSIQRNITLSKNPQTITDITAGGVARDGTLSADGYTITGGYGRPIGNASVVLANSSTGSYYTVQTNNAGFYNKTMLLPIIYDIWGSKTGYLNSTVYKKQMVGT